MKRLGLFLIAELGYFDMMTLGVLLILIVCLFIAVYVLLVQHKKINAYREEEVEEVVEEATEEDDEEPKSISFKNFFKKK